ncbi:MAG: hypothetical protein HY905_02705 [Deltaproteobacteria bacterium]|nr:hypothetical protein [Deltaproteobacteria bacterium]
MIARGLLAIVLGCAATSCRCGSDAAGSSSAPVVRLLTPPRTVATILRRQRVSTPTITWTGTEHAVVWVDDSDGTERIRFARVSKELTRIGSVAAGPEASSRDCGPSIAWTGSGFGVAWLDVDREEGTVRFARFDGEGRWTGSARTIEGRPGVYRRDEFYAGGPCVPSPSMVWAGDGFGIAWRDRRGGSTIRFRRLDPGGAPVGDEVAFRALDAAGAQGVRDPVLTWDGSRYGLAWIEHHLHASTPRDRLGNPADPATQDRVMFVAIDRGGKSVGEPIRVASDEISNDDGSIASVLVEDVPIVVWAGSSSIAQTSDADIDRDARVRFARIGTGGVALGPIEPPQTAPEGAGPGTTRRLPDGRWVGPRDWFPPLAVASSGDRLGVLWTRFLTYGAFSFGIVDADELSVHRATTTAPVGAGPPPSLVWNGTEWVVAWRDGSLSDGTVRMGRFAADGSRFEEARFPLAGLPGFGMGHAATDGGFGLVWSDVVDGRPGLVFARVDARGRVMAGPTMVADSSRGAGPTLVSNGTGFAAAWVDDRGGHARPARSLGADGASIFFAELDREGRPLGDSVLVADRDASSPRLAWTGDGYGVVWSEWQSPCAKLQPRVDPDTGGTMQMCVGAEDVHRIRFARLDRNGRRIGDIVPIEQPAEGHDHDGLTAFRPAIAWTAGGFVVSWVGELRPNVVCDCGARYTTWILRLDVEGRPLGPAVPMPAESYPGPRDGVVVPLSSGFATGLSDRPGDGSSSRLSVTVFGSQGMLGKSVLYAEQEREDADGPGVASCGPGLVAAWFVQRWAPHDAQREGASDPPGELSVVTLDRAGRIGPQRVTWSIANPNVSGGPTMACAGEVCGIAWWRYGPDESTIQFAAVACR